MSDSYRYLDPSFTYIDPKTGILRNLQSITEADVLLFVESSAVTKRLQELFDKPVKITGIISLLAIHKHLFQDMYVWAGEIRRVEISKDGKQFFPINHFESAFRYIDSLIVELRDIPKDNTRHIAQKLAEILDNINYLHPFREGNGRTQREFLRLLALDKGLILNINPADNQRVYERYMKGTTESDVSVLADLIFELIETKGT